MSHVSDQRQGGVFVEVQGRGDGVPPDPVDHHGGHDVKEVRGDFVERVKDERVVPHDDGHADRAGAHDVVDVKPFSVVGIEKVLDHDAHVDKVAKVQHKQLVFLLRVVPVAPAHEE